MLGRYTTGPRGRRMVAENVATAAPRQFEWNAGLSTKAPPAGRGLRWVRRQWGSADIFERMAPRSERRVEDVGRFADI
jgi:hypothetical protein